jgi:hypothetical protein
MQPAQVSTGGETEQTDLLPDPGDDEIAVHFGHKG